MDIKKLVGGTIAGAITAYILGYLIFNMATSGFYEANMVAEDAFRDVGLQWSIALAHIPLAVLLTLGIMVRSPVPTIGNGLVTGGIIGLLVWSQAGFYFYGFSNLYTVTVPIVDPLLELVRQGLTGAVIAFVLTKFPESAESPSSA